MAELHNLIFRIPTPVFGAGLIENIADATILANMKSELFPNERGTPPPACILNPTPEDATNFTLVGDQIPGDVVEFAHFMRFLAPPAQSSQDIPGNPPASSIQNGQALFSQIHCDHAIRRRCKPRLPVSRRGSATRPLRFSQTFLFTIWVTDWLTTSRKVALAPTNFRIAPLWGLGQRIFFRHYARSGPANAGLMLNSTPAATLRPIRCFPTSTNFSPSRSKIC